MHAAHAQIWLATYNCQNKLKCNTLKCTQHTLKCSCLSSIVGVNLNATHGNTHSTHILKYCYAAELMKLWAQIEM